jgi:hypothetical protein
MAVERMTRYDAYILRFWRSTGTDGPQWTVKVEHLGHEETREFHDLQALLQYVCDVSGVEGFRVTLERTQLE